MLRTRLAREKDQLLRATAFGVDVNHQLETGAVEIAKAEIGDFNVSCFLSGEYNSRALEVFQAPLARVGDLLLG